MTTSQKRAVSIIGAVVILSLVAFFGWRFLSDTFGTEKAVDQGNFAVSLNFACRTYAHDFDGPFPSSFAELQPEYIDWLEPFIEDENGKPMWKYFPGFNLKSKPNEILFHSREKIDGNWIRAHVGGHVTVADHLNPDGGEIHRKH